MRRENEQKQQQQHATLFLTFVQASFVKKTKMLKMFFFNEKHKLFWKTGREQQNTAFFILIG
jgi:hypothetical protein